MIYITGDIHGALEIYKVVDFFKVEKQKLNLSKKDYLIIVGDVGVCWDNGDKDNYVKETLQGLPVSTLFIDGNHENFALLNDYPVSNWNGGQVHEIEPDIIHLMRGQVFEIEEKKFFTMGGAASIDRMYRNEGISWWPEELPSQEEYEQGFKALNEHDNKVDYILSHTAPYEIVRAMGMELFEAEDTLQQYLQTIADEVNFKHWYFGHFHKDLDIKEVFHCLIDRVISLQ